MLAGKVETAAGLTLPSSVEGTKKRIEEYRAMIADRAIKLASTHVSDKMGRALVVTEAVRLTRGQEKGPLVIKLTRASNGWRVRDVDFKSAEATKDQLKRFRESYPDAKPLPAKQEKN